MSYSVSISHLFVKGKKNNNGIQKCALFKSNATGQFNSKFYAEKKMKKNTVTNFDCKRFKNFDHFIKAYVLLTGDNVHIYFHCLY